MTNNTSKHENIALLCAEISIVLFVIAAIIWTIIMMNDGSIDKDWITDKYGRLLVVSIWSGVLAFLGLLCSLINVGGFVVLLINNIHNKRFFVMNSIIPAISVTLYFISTHVEIFDTLLTAL